MKISAIILVVALPVFAAARSRAAPDAERFVTSLYQTYQQPDPPSALEPARAARIFSPFLLQQIRRAQPPSGEVGKLDFDPICACQDPDGLKLAGIDMVQRGGGNARAIVHLRFGSTTARVQLILKHTRIGWRVDDVSSDGMASLRKLLSR